MIRFLNLANIILFAALMVSHLALHATPANAKDEPFIFGCEEGQVVKWDNTLSAWICGNDVLDPETIIGLSLGVGERDAKAACPPDQRAVSGSCSFLDGANGNEILACGPAADGGGWEGEAFIVDQSNPLLVTAQCRSTQEFIADVAENCPCGFTIENFASDAANIEDTGQFDPDPYCDSQPGFMFFNTTFITEEEPSEAQWVTVDSPQEPASCLRRVTPNGFLIERATDLTDEELKACADAIIRVAEAYGGSCPANPF